jgi:hypothetical protein
MRCPRCRVKFYIETISGQCGLCESKLFPHETKLVPREVLGYCQRAILESREMGMGLQGEIVRDGKVVHCPRKAMVPVKTCWSKCKYSRGYVQAVRLEGSLPDRERVAETLTVWCAFPTRREFEVSSGEKTKPQVDVKRNKKLGTKRS